MTAPAARNIIAAVVANDGSSSATFQPSSSSASCNHHLGVFDDYLKHCYERCSKYNDWDQLLFACQQNKVSTIQYLIEECHVDPSYSNPMKQSAIHIAARYGHVECLQVLLQHIPKENMIQVVNSQNRLSGSTPLHCCLQKISSSTSSSMQQRMACIRLLIQAGANLDIADAFGKTPLDYWKANFDTDSSLYDDDNDDVTNVFMGQELQSKLTV